jgi:hypothetical protein
MATKQSRTTASTIPADLSMSEKGLRLLRGCMTLGQQVAENDLGGLYGGVYLTDERAIVALGRQAVAHNWPHLRAHSFAALELTRCFVSGYMGHTDPAAAQLFDARWRADIDWTWAAPALRLELDGLSLGREDEDRVPVAPTQSDAAPRTSVAGVAMLVAGVPLAVLGMLFGLTVFTPDANGVAFVATALVLMVLCLLIGGALIVGGARKCRTRRAPAFTYQP